MSDTISTLKPRPLVNHINKLIKIEKNEILTETEYLLLNERYKEAEQYIMTTYPKASLSSEVEPLTLIGIIQKKLNQKEIAFKYFEMASKVNDNADPFVDDCLGMSLFEKGEYEKSIIYLEEAVHLNKKEPIYHLHLAFVNEKLMYSKSQSDKMIAGEDIRVNRVRNPELKIIKDKIKDEYESTIDLDKNCYLALLNYGVFQAKEGYFEEAEKLLKKAIEIEKFDYKPFLNLANLELRREQYKKATDYFETVLELTNNNVGLSVLIPYMTTLSKLEEWIKLEKISKKILIIDKNNMKALAWLMKALKENRKYDDLEKLLKRVKKKLHYYSQRQLQNVQGMKKEIYSKLKKRIKEEINEVKAVKKNVKNMNLNSDRDEHDSNYPHLNKIDLDTIKALGFDEKETKELVEKLKDDKNNLDALFRLGLIKFKEEDYIESEVFFKKIYSINNNYKKNIVCEKLGDITLKLHNEPKTALIYFDKAIHTEANEVLFIKEGRCYEMIDDFENALKEYKKAYEINNNFVWSIFHIGNVMLKLNIPDAKDWLKQAYEKEKENVDILQKYGDVLVRSDNHDDIKLGIEILEKAKDFYTGNVDIMCSLAIGYEKKKMLKEAIELLENANNYPQFFSDENKLFQLALYYEENKNFKKAVEFFKSVLVINSTHKDALLHLAFIYKAAKEFKKSYKCFSAILDRDPNNASANFGMARLYQLMSSNDNDSVQYYLQCLKKTPDNIIANIELGIIYLKNKNLDNALKYLNKAYELNPKNILCLTALGNVYQEKKDYELAEKYLKESYDIDKKNIATLSSYGDVLFTQGKYEHAIERYEKVIKMQDIPEVHFHLGHCYYMIEQFDYAISNYVAALKSVKNTRHDYYFYLACALIAAGRTKDALKCYKAAIKLKKKNEYYFHLANAYYLSKKYKKTIAALEKFTKLESENPTEHKILQKDVDYLMFKAYSSLPTIDYDKCFNLISGLIDEEPNNIEYLDCLASLQEKTDKTKEAIETYKKIRTIDPNNENSKNSLARLQGGEVDEEDQKSGNNIEIEDSEEDDGN